MAASKKVKAGKTKRRGMNELAHKLKAIDQVQAMIEFNLDGDRYHGQ